MTGPRPAPSRPSQCAGSPTRRAWRSATSTPARSGTGSVVCWGRNADGQLGDGTLTSRLTPAEVPGLTDVARVALDGSHSCAVRRDGLVLCWGRNDFGQLGDGTLVNRRSPTVTPVTDAAAVETGPRHTCALRRSGAVACWGANNAGQLGLGTLSDTVPAPRAAVFGLP